MSQIAPDGFIRFDHIRGSTFTSFIGPLFVRIDPEEGPVFGFRVDERHANTMDICHGGMIASFADTYLATLSRFNPAFDDGYTPTISLTLDYLGQSKLGQWVEGRGRLLRRTGRINFSEGLVTADGEPVLRASATFRRGKAGERTDTNEALQELVGTWTGD